MRRFLAILLLVALMAAAASAAERSLVLLRTAGENGPAFSGVGLELAAEVPGGFLAFLDDADVARLATWSTDHVVISADDPATDILVQYDVPAGARHTDLPYDTEVLHREPTYTVLRVVHDEELILSCLPDIQRVFRRPLRFVTTTWEAPPAADKSRDADPDIQAMVDTIEQAWLAQQVQTLEDFGTRHSQHSAGEQASYWIRDQFLGWGYFDVLLHDYNSWNDNVVCTKVGTVYPDRYVVIGGHYDSTSSSNPIAPGADDNATGTTAVLAAARALADYEFEFSIVFIAFSGEEQGLVGSDAWASEAAAAGLDIVGCIAIDMLGYRAPGDAADIDIITNSASQPLRDLVDVAAADYVPTHTVVTGSLPGGASSDHASFWASGYRSVLFFEDTGNYSPYIHSANDVMGTSVNDLAFMELNVRTAVATLAMLARPFRIAISHEPLPHAEGVGPFAVTCDILAAEPLDPAMLQLHYRTDGSPFNTVALAPTGTPGQYGAEIPELFAGMEVEYYLSAGDDLGRTATDPLDAPTVLHSFRTGVYSRFADDVETDQGWTLGAAGDNATTGQWIWADPVGTTYQPENDHTEDPGQLCFVTGNGLPGDTAGAADVDGGRTTLVSPVFDLTGAVWAEFSYWRYYVVETTYDDVFTVEISNDGGQTWNNLETVTGTEGWIRAGFQFDESDHFLTHMMQLRFIAEDTGGGSLVEALIDDVSIVASNGTPLGAGDDLPIVATVGAYPNPFNPQTTLTYALPRAGFAELRVFDARGREVARPLADVQPAGAGEATWNAEGLASGVYMVQLSLDGAVQRATKLTLVR